MRRSNQFLQIGEFLRHFYQNYFEYIFLESTMISFNLVITPIHIILLIVSRQLVDRCAGVLMTSMATQLLKLLNYQMLKQMVCEQEIQIYFIYIFYI